MFHWRPRSLTCRIILHDSRTPPDTPSATALMRTKGREMGLLEIGYHFVIERDGTVVQCRPPEVIGSHTPGHNHDSIGVCLAGHGDYTPEQITNLGFLVWSLRKQFGEEVYLLGHYEVQRLRHRPKCPAIDMNNLRETLCLTPNP